MQSNQIARTSVVTIRIYQTSDGHVALQTVEGTDRLFDVSDIVRMLEETESKKSGIGERLWKIRPVRRFGSRTFETI
jgi:hypothetical protein